MMLSKALTFITYALLSITITKAVASPDGFREKEYGQLLIELGSEIQTFIIESYECEKVFSETGDQRNQHCQDALLIGQRIIGLTKIVSIDQSYPGEGITDDLINAYKISAIRLIDTIEHGNPDLRVKAIKQNNQ